MHTPAGRTRPRGWPPSCGTGYQQGQDSSPLSGMRMNASPCGALLPAGGAPSAQHGCVLSTRCGQVSCKVRGPDTTSTRRQQGPSQGRGWWWEGTSPGCGHPEEGCWGGKCELRFENQRVSQKNKGAGIVRREACTPKGLTRSWRQQRVWLECRVRMRSSSE